jgi:hypothetical protein
LSPALPSTHDKRHDRTSLRKRGRLTGRDAAGCQARGLGLRIMRAEWLKVKKRFRADPAVRRDRSRRDWTELHLSSAANLDRLSGLLAAEAAANT